MRYRFMSHWSRPWNLKLAARVFAPVSGHRNVSSAIQRTPNESTFEIPETQEDREGKHTQHGSPTVTSIQASIIAHYWDTTPPKRSDLKEAARFFLAHKPSLLFSSEKFRTVKMNTSNPEVAFLGRSNVGKSSLLNALLGANICHTSKKPGRTRSMNFFAVGGEDGFGSPGRLTVIDMPGYGHGSREEWGPEIMKYLVGRRQLRRAFLLVDAMHGLKASDKEVLHMFRQNAVPHQVLLSKVDRILDPKRNTAISEKKLFERAKRLEEQVKEIREIIQPKHNDGAAALGEIICFSTMNMLLSSKNVGINHIRWAILAATGLGQKLDKPQIVDVSDYTVQGTPLDGEDNEEDNWR